MFKQIVGSLENNVSTNEQRWKRYALTLYMNVTVNVFAVSARSGEEIHMPEVLASLNSYKRDFALPPNALSIGQY